jgi:hypothetical protein
MADTKVFRDMVWKLGKLQSGYNEVGFYVESNLTPCTSFVLLRFINQLNSTSEWLDLDVIRSLYWNTMTVPCRGVGAALKVCVWGGGGTLSVRQKRVTFKGVRGRAREKILKLESLKSHFLHFRRRFTILFMLWIVHI